VPSYQKLGIILENKMLLTWQFQILCSKKKLGEIQIIFDIEN